MSEQSKMTNEEAFFKAIPTFGHALGDEEIELAEKVWQAAIAYMQEQSEPVAWATFYENGVVHHVTKYVHPTMNGSHLDYKPLFTTTPRQQPLKRLSDEDIEKVFQSIMIQFGRDYRNDIANAIMDEIERINK